MCVCQLSVKLCHHDACCVYCENHDSVVHSTATIVAIRIHDVMRRDSGMFITTLELYILYWSVLRTYECMHRAALRGWRLFLRHETSFDWSQLGDRPGDRDSRRIDF